MAGEVVEINSALDSDAGVVNRDPYGDGWMVKLRISSPDDLKGLMSPSRVPVAHRGVTAGPMRNLADRNADEADDRKRRASRA